VAASGLSRRCKNSPAISAPALVARDRSSSSDSSALNSGMDGAFEDGELPSLAPSDLPDVLFGLGLARFRQSSPTRNARSFDFAFTEFGFDARGIAFFTD